VRHGQDDGRRQEGDRPRQVLREGRAEGGGSRSGRLSNADLRLFTTFQNIEIRGGCVFTGDAPAVESGIDSAVGAFVTALQPATTDGAAVKCAVSKIKAAAKKAEDQIKCHSSAFGRGQPVDARCLAKAGSKLLVAFQKAETRGGCTTTDGAAIDHRRPAIDGGSPDADNPVEPRDTRSRGRDRPHLGGAGGRHGFAAVAFYSRHEASWWRSLPPFGASVRYTTGGRRRDSRGLARSARRGRPPGRAAGRDRPVHRLTVVAFAAGNHLRSPRHRSDDEPVTAALIAVAFALLRSIVQRRPVPSRSSSRRRLLLSSDGRGRAR
jgi:hypothetical protein